MRPAAGPAAATTATTISFVESAGGA